MLDGDPICAGVCNTTPGSVVRATVKPEPLYFLCPATGEILECPAKSVADFRKESGLLNGLVDNLLICQQFSFDATQLLLAAQTGIDSSKTQQAEKKLDQAIKAETKAREAMFKEFKDLPKSNDGASGLMELLPLATSKGKKLEKTRRVTYVRSDKVKSYKRVYHNLSGDSAKLKAFYTVDSSGAYKLDSKKLGESLRKIPIKGELTKQKSPSGQMDGHLNLYRHLTPPTTLQRLKKKQIKTHPRKRACSFQVAHRCFVFLAGLVVLLLLTCQARASKNCFRGVVRSVQSSLALRVLASIWPRPKGI